MNDKIIGSNNINNINTHKKQLQYDSMIISKAILELIPIVMS